MTSNGGPLAGTRVIDFGQFFAGPFAARLLADLGADVIKVEPMTGDPLRALDRVFSAAQRGKRAISIDLKIPRGHDIMQRLLSRADVTIHNLRPGVAERLGLDYAAVSRLNKKIIYVYCPGWGSTGPDASRQSFAFMLLGLVGLQYEVAGAGNPPTLPVGNEDTGNGLLAAVATVMALLDRTRTGTGTYVESPQLNSALFMAMHVFRDAGHNVHGSVMVDTQQTGTGPFNRLYQTADGWICIVADRDDEQAALMRLVGGSPSFTTDDALTRSVIEFVQGRPTAMVDRELQEAKVPHTVPVMDGGLAALNDRESIESGRVAQYKHPVYGVVREPGSLVRFASGTSTGRPAPLPGQHADEILDELGFNAHDITRLREQRIIG